MKKEVSYKKTDKVVLMDDKGISALIGILLVLAISVIFAGILQSKSVPEWNKEIEAEHFNTLYADTLDIRQAIASLNLPKTIVIHTSLDYPTRMFLQNPSKPGATISTYNDKRIWITGDGIIPIDENSCTIHIKENYYYFLAPELIIEHGMIIGDIGHSPPYIIDDPLMNNKTIDLDLVECTNNSIGTTSSLNIHLFPVSDIPVNNATVTFTTDFPELWDMYLKSIKVNPIINGNKITLNYSNSTRIRITRIGPPDPSVTPTSTPTSTPTPPPTPTPTPTPSPTTAISRTYTIDADFDEGSLTTLNHDIIHDLLQIDDDVTDMNYHFIWVPNTNLGTVSKVDTRTGNEVGRYRVNSNTSHGGDPSRTTVDLKGDVWVGTRRAGTVVKIGDYESGHCLDRNGDGAIETSRDTNNDGNITGAELLDWGKDECVLYEVVLISGKEGTFIPGNYTRSYDTDFVGTAPRGLAIDANNNLWAGTYTTGKYFYIDGATGQINKTINVPGHWAYGAVIDKNGILWSAKLRDHILRINTSNLTDIKTININNTYGFCLDYSGHLFTAGFQDSSKPNRLAKFDINGMNPVLMWDIPAKTFRGVVATRDNNIWVAGGITTSEDISNYNSVSRYDNNGTLIKTISGFKQPSGVAVDKEGKVWVTDIGSNNIYRIDPATNTVDLTKDIIESGGHYTYSDMTGFIARTITTTIGTWTVIFDSGTANIPWGTISWNSSEPSGTSVKVSVRTSNDKSNWSAWKNVASGFPLDPMLNGRYVEMETTLQILSGNTSPILYDLTVSSASYNP